MHMKNSIITFGFLLLMVSFPVGSILNGQNGQAEPQKHSKNRPTLGMQLGSASWINISDDIDHVVGTSGNMEGLFPIKSYGSFDILTGFNIYIERHFVDGVFNEVNQEESRASFIPSPDNYKNNNFSLLYLGIPIDFRYRFNNEHNRYITFGYRFGYKVWDTHSYRIGNETFQDRIGEMNSYRSDFRFSVGKFLGSRNNSSRGIRSAALGGFYQLNGLALDGEVNNWGLFIGLTF